MFKKIKTLALMGTIVLMIFPHVCAAELLIGYVTKSATNAGWIMINNGAKDAAKEAGVKLLTVGPAFQGDLSSQLEVFENLVSQGVRAIGIAPVDSAGIARLSNQRWRAALRLSRLTPELPELMSLHLLRRITRPSLKYRAGSCQIGQKW